LQRVIQTFKSLGESKVDPVRMLLQTCDESEKIGEAAAYALDLFRELIAVVSSQRNPSQLTNTVQLGSGKFLISGALPSAGVAERDAAGRGLLFLNKTWNRLYMRLLTLMSACFGAWVLRSAEPTCDDPGAIGQSAFQSPHCG
jgi:hypothetical protein